MKKYDAKASELDEGAFTFVVELAKASKRVQLVVVWKWRRGLFQSCVTDPLQTTSAILGGSKSSVRLLRIVIQDAMSEVSKLYMHLDLNVCVDGIKLHF